jgi:hypothetical protein
MNDDFSNSAFVVVIGFVAGCVAAAVVEIVRSLL